MDTVTMNMNKSQVAVGGEDNKSSIPHSISANLVPSSPSKTKRKSSSLPSETVEYLKAWMMSPDHIAHPYPTEQEKAKIMEDTGIELKQLTNWFVNNRKRYWKPRVDARLQDKPQVNTGSPMSATLIKPKEIHSPFSLGRFASLIVAPSGNGLTLVDKTVPGTCDIMTQMPSSLCHLGSPARAVSEQSSLVSETDSVSSCQDQDDFSASQSTEEASVIKTESVTVRILRSVGGNEPSLEDVTILPNVPTERVVRFYESCMLTYKLPVGIMADRKKVSQDDARTRLKIARDFICVHFILISFLSLPLNRFRAVATLKLFA
jgi:hypothetical protein